MIISKRRKKLPLRTRVASRITDIPGRDWGRVFPDVLESYDFFKTLDESDLKQFTFYYIMVYDGKTPVGATACFLMSYSLDTSIVGPLKKVTTAIKKAAPNIFCLKALICGTPLGQGRIGIAGRPDAVMTAIVRRMEQIARKNKAPIIAFKDFEGSYFPALDPLKKTGFSKLSSLPWTERNIEFKNFEEYMMTLSGATRYDLRRKFKKTAHVKIEMEVVDAIEGDVLCDLYKLYLDIVARHEMEFEILSIDFFRKISENMPKHTKFFLWRIDGKLAAFLFCLVSKDILIDFYVGFDYSIAHKYHLYFVKFRDTINWCIKHGIKKYEMGSTGYEPKKRLGFNLVPLYVYAKLRNRVLRPVFNLLCQFLKFENFDDNLKKS
jgi:predicted N-acyltransferase